MRSIVEKLRKKVVGVSKQNGMPEKFVSLQAK
jgi:hypothetical protein